MIYINELNNILPIVYDGKRIEFLSLDDLNKYVNNCRLEYYNEFMDFNFKADVTKRKLTNIIYDIVIVQKIKEKSRYEARLVLKDIKKNKIIGGCTIFEKVVADTIELAYFIVPEYQHRGLGAEMLSNIMSAMKESDIAFNKLVVTIRYDNVRSLQLVKNLGFKELAVENGKYKKNIILYIDRTSIHEIE